MTAETTRIEPRREPLPLDGFGVAHPRAFLCDVVVGRTDVSRAIPHANNADYVRWLDRAAELHADALGFTRAGMLERGIMWFVARHEIDYLAEAWVGDALVMATWVRDMHRVRSWRDSVLLRPADATVVCRAATLWVLVDLSSRRPARIPPEMGERFDPLHRTPRDAAPCTSA